MKLEYFSPSEEQKNKKQLGDCPEVPASFTASWADRRWSQDGDELLATQMPSWDTLSVLDPAQFTSSEKGVGWFCFKGDRDLSFWRSGGNSLDRASRCTFWRTVASSLPHALEYHALPGHGSEQVFGKWFYINIYEETCTLIRNWFLKKIRHLVHHAMWAWVRAVIQCLTYWASITYPVLWGTEKKARS